VSTGIIQGEHISIDGVEMVLVLPQELTQELPGTLSKRNEVSGGGSPKAVVIGCKSL
jgi:hypothetical protein